MLYSYAFDEKIKEPFAKYIGKTILFKIPSKDSEFFKENVISYFDVIFKKLSKQPDFNNFPRVNYSALIKTTLSFSPEFISRLKSEASFLSPNQTELFLEYNRYNHLFGKKYNPLFDILRIKKGILTNKIISSDYKQACMESYHGFIRVLETKTARFIKLKVNGKEKVFLVKNFSGYPEKGIREGVYTVALDLKNFNLYAFKNRSQTGKINLPEGKRLGANKHLLDNFTDFEFSKKIHTNPTSSAYAKEITNDIINQVLKIKSLLKKYTPSKSKPRISSFKKDAKKMLKDKKTREIIKKRFRK